MKTSLLCSVTLFLLLNPCCSVAESATNRDKMCRVVGIGTVNAACSKPMIIRAGQVTPPQAFVIAMAVREVACSKTVKPLIKKGVESGCSYTVKKVGDLITITIKDSKRNANRMAQIYRCITNGDCVSWLMVNLAR